MISAGDIDDRPIQEVRVEDLRGYTRIHLFAGIGGWERALNLAGWGDSPILTASLPCQPFSAAGKQKSIRDDRHLWPIVRELIEGLNPPFVIGEQVASAEVVGTQQETAFLESVQSGDYARANKLAKRLAQSKSFHYWPRWVDGIQADLEKAGYAFRFMVLGAHSLGAPHIRQRLFWVANTKSQRGRWRFTVGVGRDSESRGPSEVGGLAHAEGRRVGIRQKTKREAKSSGIGTAGFWDDAVWIPCADGKTRRIKPGLEPLVDGLPGRVGLLRGTGNAIVPQVAAAFIKMNITIMKRDKENEME